MQHEELTFRRAIDGAVDVAAMNAWLGRQPYAFFDPVSRDGWHVSTTVEDMQHDLAERIADPLRYPVGARIFISPDRVIVVTGRAFSAERRAFEFVAWLVRDGSWLVERDQSPPEPVGDPRRLFPDGIDEHDHTADSLTEGVRTTLDIGDRMLIVHSSGQWRSMEWRGELTPRALAEWGAAVKTVREQDDAFREYVEPDPSTGRFELETPGESDVAYFCASQIPEELRPIVLLVERWLTELAVWTFESTSADFQRVRST